MEYQQDAVNTPQDTEIRPFHGLLHRERADASYENKKKRYFLRAFACWWTLDVLMKWEVCKISIMVCCGFCEG